MADIVCLEWSNNAVGSSFSVVVCHDGFLKKDRFFGLDAVLFGGVSLFDGVSLSGMVASGRYG